MEGRTNLTGADGFAAGANFFDEVTAEKLNAVQVLANDANDIFSRSWEVGGIATGKVMTDDGSVLVRIDSIGTGATGGDYSGQTIHLCINSASYSMVVFGQTPILTP